MPNEAIQLSVIESKVLSLIPKGTERKTSLTEIEKLIDIDIRSIQATINSLIRKNVPIVAVRGYSDGGIFIATTDEEREIGLRSLESQAKDMTSRAKLVRACDLDNWESNLISAFQEQLEV